MRPNIAIPAAAGFLLALAAGASAAPISLESGSVTAHGAYWTVPATYHPQPQVWGRKPGHHPHGLDLAALMRQYAQRTHGSAKGPWGMAHWDEDFAFPAWLCGGKPGADGSDYVPEGPGPGAPDEEESDPVGGEGSQGGIADQNVDRNPSPGIPAVPEPGSLAMLSAGALGLLAARAFLKRR